MDSRTGLRILVALLALVLAMPLALFLLQRGFLFLHLPA
jgi:hypothetical protein